MAHTIRKKSKEDVLNEREVKKGGKKIIKRSRQNDRSRLKNIDYNDPAALEDMEDEYTY